MHGPIPRIIEPLEGAPINGLGEHQVGPSYYPVDFFTALHPPILSSAGANVNQLTLPSPGFSSSRQTSHWSTAKPARIGRGAHRGRKQPSTIGSLHGTSNGTLPPPRTTFFRGSNASSFNEYARSSGSSGFRSTNSTPPIQNLHDVASHPFLLLSHDTAGGSFQQRRHSIPSTASGVLPYLIDLHVAAASAVQVHNGPETHIIQGMGWTKCLPFSLLQSDI
ncbi:hypothetical protein RvY_01386 [Ramazzottius varieornatus]|uniref:Uncharacterized protein n=1 Tax=Ramazzottius varieornatus TaxID=947166 RepID=A0A1D1URC0_RAMVA|nr:hypothetical protein RvY_01386 [Ramazzottius varieornatus]